MDLSSYALEPLRAGDLTLYRGSGNGVAPALLVTAENSSSAYLKRLEQEYALRAELDAAWAARPVALSRYNGRLTLVLEDPGGEPLDRLLSGPLELTLFLRIAVPLAKAIRRVHARGLIHKDVKPANILVDLAGGSVWLTGFGLASRLPREHPNPDAPEVIAGTLAYMAPEQTGRMNRSIDARSDLYSLGVTFYEMLTGTLPFTATDPLEWVHCHIARQPTPPDKRISTVPAQLAAIVMKLLAKTAAERYQTAAGLEADLRQCLAEWGSHGRIDPFQLGAQDALDRLVIPERLYGRKIEIDALLAAFDRVVAHGATQLVLVSGYAGIGKSSVVNELHKALVSSRGLFGYGKLDKYKSDIPYATLGHAFQSLVRTLLGQSEMELGRWRDALREALGADGRLLVNLVPELELIIGTQPPVPHLSAQAAKHRFQRVFQAFLGVFARKEHPLALFLDDLQWVDAAMLDLLEDLVTGADLQHLMLIAAYRDNEVDSAHPLMRTIEAIRRGGVTVQEILLAPLSIDDLGRLIADSLHCEAERVTSLAQLIHAKTAGNPFFAIQFIASLAEERLLTFDPDEARWSWDLNRIHAKGYSDNVADLLVERLNRLSVESRQALQRLACIGNSAEIAMLALVQERSEDEVHADLREAVRLELVSRLEGSYSFVHDRVHEAAYCLLPEKSRAEAHLRIGWLLKENIPLEKREEAIFEIVSHLNRGAALVTSRHEREQIAELNLLAGKRAKDATAYASALRFLVAADELLARGCRERRHDLVFQLELNRAECEFLSGDPASAADRLSILSTRAVGRSDQAAVTCLRMALYTTRNHSVLAIEVGLEFLHTSGLGWSLHPTDEAVGTELARMVQLLENRPVEALIDLPLMDDPDCLATVAVLAEMTGPAFFADHNLFSLVILHIANLSIAHGNCDVSPLAYALLNIVLGVDFGDYRNGVRFGQLGCDLVDERGLDRFKARVYMTFGTWCVPWAKPLPLGQPVLRKAIDLAHSAGDLTFEGYGRLGLITNMMSSGVPLAEAQEEAEDGLAFARKARFGLVADCFLEVLLLIRDLRGSTTADGLFEEPSQDRIWFERHLREAGASLAAASVRYWTHRLQACFLAEDNEGALAAAAQASGLLWSARAYQTLAEYHFYSALALACDSDAVPIEKRQPQMDEIEAHRRAIANWAEGYLPNYAHKTALIAAEIARLESRELHAERLYEEAIQSARQNGFMHNEALAQELAARFYAARGFETISNAYLQNARACYVRWGADGKVRQIDLKYPNLVPHLARLGSDRTIGTPIEQLDLTTVVKMSQAVSGEIEFNNLIEILMKTALEHAGAARGLLILPRGEEMWIEAEATTAKGTLDVRRPRARIAPSALPESVFHYVIRTRDSVLLDDAMVQEPFSQDVYVRQNTSRSMLCLPLIKQTQLIGVLYLENGLASHVFAPARISLLRLLASQAATSLENARLYSELRDADASLAQAQRLSSTGSFSWRVSTGEITWSAQLYRIFEFDQGVPVTLELIGSRVHPADIAKFADMIARARANASDFEYEHRLVMPDHSIKYLHLVAHASRDRDGQLEYIGASQDVTHRRLSEEALSKARSELAHVARVTSIGALTASIAHEVTQPLAGIVSNADSCLLWLAKEEPNLDKARRAAERIVRDGHRTAKIIQGIRAQARKSAPEMVILDIRHLIGDTLELVQSELQRHAVSVETRFLAIPGFVEGDPTQLQQVIVNLFMNAIEAIDASTRSPRVIRVITESDQKGGVLTSVEDSGSGIDAEALGRIFEPMFTTKPQGMGLGLSICRSIVEGHGGRLWASPNPTGGSIFRFSIPEATNAEAPRDTIV